MVQEVLPNLFCIRIPLEGNPLRELNSYVIMGKDRVLLIDTGFRQEPCRRALAAGLRELNVRQEDTDVLLTHLHADHSGLAPEFAGRERSIFISGSDHDYLDINKRTKLWQRADVHFLAAGFPMELLQRLRHSVPSRSMTPPDCGAYHILSDGDSLEAGGYRLTAVLTPGHTPGHMCYWMEEQGVMFTGDHVLFDITPNITSWVGVENSLGDYMNSLRAIRSYDVKLALPGHRATGDFHARIDALLRHHAARLAECMDVVRARPGLTVYEIASFMTWKIRADSWETFPDNQKWFAVGECMSHLDYLGADGRVRLESDGHVNRYFAKD